MSCLGRSDNLHRCCADDDFRFVYQEYALDPGDDVTDMAVVKRANPASWQTEQALRDRFEDPGQTLQRFKRFACGLWVRSEGSAIQPEEWDALAQPGVEIPPGSPVWVGWDNAIRGPDTTALVPLWMKSADERIFGDPVVLTAPKDGFISDLDVEKALKAMAERWKIERIVYDPEAGAYSLALRLERASTAGASIGTLRVPLKISKADVRFLEAVREKRIVHSGDPVFRNHVLNAVEQSVSSDGRWKFGRPRGTRVPTDALRAASMVHHRAARPKGEPPKLEFL